MWTIFGYDYLGHALRLGSQTLVGWTIVASLPHNPRRLVTTCLKHRPGLLLGTWRSVRPPDAELDSSSFNHHDHRYLRWLRVYTL